MNEVTVTTKEELKKAKDEKIETIIVQGELADKLQKTKKLAYRSTSVIAVLACATALIPATRGLSTVVGITSVATVTGTSVATITVAISIGLTLLVAVFKEYDEIDAEAGYLKLRLRRHKK